MNKQKIRDTLGEIRTLPPHLQTQVLIDIMYKVIDKIGDDE